MSRIEKRLLCGTLVLLCAAAGLGLPEVNPAMSQPDDNDEDHGIGVRRVVVTRYKSRTFELRKAFASAVVGAPDIADVLAMSGRTL